VELFELPRAEVLYYCLHHDSGELFAGDLPFGSKIKVDGLKDAMDEAESIGLKKLGITLPNLTKQEKTRVKICDLLEMWETGEYETLSGNKYAEPIMTDTLAAVMHIAEEEDDNKQTWQIIMNWIGERSLP
jgi:5'-deoxynucleotidase YfbR-like HD superfamily hydrolase